MNYKQIWHIFYILMVGVFIVGVEPFTPEGRDGHSSILIGSKLYFFGGTISSNSISNEVFYLDVSKTFNIASPPWTDLTISAKIPFGSSWAGMSSIIDANNDTTAYLFGGIMRDPISRNDTFISNVFTFNIKTLEWKIPNINGKVPERRYAMRAVSDNKGKLYIFGGTADKFVASPKTQFFNDMIIMDTTSLAWSYGSTLNAPIKRSGYSATMLSNGVIVYIGGKEFKLSTMVAINQIDLYDTNLDTWSAMIAKITDTIIEPRSFHSAVLAPDGNIIIYGGRSIDPADPEGLSVVSVEPDIAILNTQNTPFKWIAPTVSSNIGKIPSLSASTTDLIGNYMIVAFGLITPAAANVENLSSKIYIMDIRNYTWIDTFEAIMQNESTNKPSAPSATNTNHTMKNVVIGVISGILGMAFLIGFLGYKWYRKQKRKDILNIPGSSDYMRR